MNKKQKRLFVIAVIGSLILGIVFAQFVIPHISETISTWGMNELLTVITFAGVLAALAAPLIDSYLQKKLEYDRREYEKIIENGRRDFEKEKADKEKMALYQIDIDVKMMDNNYVLFSAVIENVGDKRITTKVANLYIDQGKAENIGSKVNVKGTLEPGAVYYDFPFILEHKRFVNGRPDCILCTRCRDDGSLTYPEDQIKNNPKFKDLDLYYTNIPLLHLSDKSINYINPKEKFSEDVILQFKNSGVYRVTFIVTTSDGEADCECATKQFYIP